MKRQIVNSSEDFWQTQLTKLMGEDEVIAEYGLTSDYSLYHCIIDKYSDDVQAALEDTLQRLVENHLEKYIYGIMGAYIPDEEELQDLQEFDEYIDIDLGYVLPGLIMDFKKLV